MKEKDESTFLIPLMKFIVSWTNHYNSMWALAFVYCCCFFFFFFCFFVVGFSVVCCLIRCCVVFGDLLGNLCFVIFLSKYYCVACGFLWFDKDVFRFVWYVLRVCFGLVWGRMVWSGLVKWYGYSWFVCVLWCMPSGPIHPYWLDEFISNFSGVWCTFSFLFYFE